MYGAKLLVAALVASVSLTGVSADLSCQGNCGSYAQDGSNYCYCDAYCTYNGDCCDDAISLCLSPSSPSSGGSGSCQGYCGSQNTESSCYCDSICSVNPFGDCCSDWSDVCGSVSPSPSSSGSCQGNCGGCDAGDYDYYYGSSCCCDSICSLIGDCCTDISTYCSSPPGASGSCSGYCGNYWDAAQACHCDTVCTEYGDCCSDYTNVCNSNPTSCQGNCGLVLGACNCDDLSTYFGDSCSDYTTYCGSGASPAPPAPCGSGPDSCAGYCDSSPPSSPCYCDTFCTVAGDCCCDAETLCNVKKPDPGSCNGICGSYNQNSDGTYCYCDDYCTYNGDCCSDHDTYCPHSTPPPPNAAASCVTSGLCGSYNSAFSCGCDDACTVFNDCCDSYNECTTTAPSHGDSKDDPIIISSLPYDFEGSTTDFTDKGDVPQECTDDYKFESSGVDVWFQYTPSTAVSVNISLCGEGTNFDSYVYLEEEKDGSIIGKACNDDANRDGCGLGSELAAVLDAGSTYYIVIDGYGPSDKGDFHLQISVQQGNTVQDAIVIGSLPFDYQGTTIGYDDTYSPPSECAQSTASDVVFKYFSTSDTSITLSLCGSGFDNVMYIMNSTLSILEDKCNDDGDRDGCTTDAFLTLDAKAYVNYYIVVDGYSQSKGEFRLQVEELKGNTESDAISIGTSLPFEDEGDTSKHSNNFDGVIAKGCSVPTSAPDVFYKAYYFTARDVTIDVCSDDFDTVLFVYQQGSSGSPLLQTCNDDTNRQGCSKASSVSVKLQGLQTYYIVVDGTGSGSGKYRLTIKENNGDSSTNPITIPSLPYVHDGTSGDFTHTYDLSSDCKGSKADGPDVWFKYYSPAAQDLNITTCGSAVDTIVALLADDGTTPTFKQCNDDGSHQECSTASELITTVDGDQSYFVLVAFGTDDPSTYRLEITSSLLP